jgi:hypothetical protein
MKATILSRLNRLEKVQAIENLPPVEFQTGYLKKLPPDYTVTSSPSAAIWTARIAGRSGRVRRPTKAGVISRHPSELSLRSQRMSHRCFNLRLGFGRGGCRFSLSFGKRLHLSSSSAASLLMAAISSPGRRTSPPLILVLHPGSTASLITKFLTRRIYLPRKLVNQNGKRNGS